jgi:MscS family membrane protein
MKRLMRITGAATFRAAAGVIPLLTLAACFEPRIDKNANPEKVAQLKLFSAPPPEWAMHQIDMPQFSANEEAQIIDWFEDGKIETDPVKQPADFQFVNSLERLLTTGEADDKVKIRRDMALTDLTLLSPTQLEIYWGNLVPKVIDTLSNKTKFSACDGSILAAADKGRYYILDGHHRWGACLFIRRFLGKPAEYQKIFAPFKYYEERQIFELLNNPELSKIKTLPEMKITALEGNPKGILRVLYELAKFGHGRFNIPEQTDLSKNPLAYLKRTMFLDNPLLQWIYFALVILSSLIASKLLLIVLRLNTRNKEETTKRVAVIELILQTFKKYIYSVSFLIFIKLCLPLLSIPPAILSAIQTGLMVVVIWLMTIFASRLFGNFMLGWQERIRQRDADTDVAHLFPLFSRIGKILIYFIGILFIMNRVGYNIYSAIAGLSVGGFALAMAGREAVGHIFAGISLYIDKVVKEGDYLLLEKEIGTWGRVEKVGMRSTTIRTKFNSILVMPNSLLANGAVVNVTAGGFKRMYRGKILLAQNTPAAALDATLTAIRRIITEAGNTLDIDVHFMKFEAFGFYVRVQYFVEPFTKYHDTVSIINVAVLKYLTERNISLAVDLEKLREMKKGP